MSQIHFKPNVPVTLALKDTTAVPEGPRWRYLLSDGRDLVVTSELAASINLLELSPGEPFGVCQYWDGDPKHASEWNVWRTPEAEKARARTEPEGDLVPLLRESVQIVARRKQASAAIAELSKPSIGTTENGKPNGTQPLHTRAQAPGKIPYNVAVVEVLQFVTRALQQAGEQWNDSAKQDLVSTVLIDASKAGHLTLWERSS